MNWSSMWDVVWFTIVIFAFVAYLMLLFMILNDLFRDHKLHPMWKVVWIIFLIVIPYVTAFVYLLTRWRGMSERQIQANQQAETEARHYIKQAAGTGSPAEHIAAAKELLDAGTITQPEFDQLKAKALAV